MLSLIELWIPILVAAVLVFAASSVLHMCLPIHKGDCEKLPNEAAVLDAMRGEDLAPGQYTFPFACSMKEMASPEMIEKYKRGPVGLITIMPTGVPAIGKSLAQWFVFGLFVSTLVAYTAMIGLERGAEWMPVLRLTSAVALLAYSFAHISDSIWKGQSWMTTLKFIFDGVVYALVTGATFAWLWPGAA